MPGHAQFLTDEERRGEKKELLSLGEMGALTRVQAVFEELRSQVRPAQQVPVGQEWKDKHGRKDGGLLGPAMMFELHPKYHGTLLKDLTKGTACWISILDKLFLQPGASHRALGKERNSRGRGRVRGEAGQRPVQLG